MILAKIVQKYIHFAFKKNKVYDKTQLAVVASFGLNCVKNKSTFFYPIINRLKKKLNCNDIKSNRLSF